MLAEAERVAKDAETWELTGAGAFGEGQTRAPGLLKASERLGVYLKAHPEDVGALLLQARVLRALIVVTPVAIKLEDQGSHVTAGDTTTVRRDALAALDKIVALDPKNAEAYYWKARTLMLSNQVAVQVGAEQALDPFPAIDAAKRAVNLAPENTTFREYLALGLMGTGRRDEGLQELRKLPGKHPIL